MDRITSDHFAPRNAKRDRNVHGGGEPTKATSSTQLVDMKSLVTRVCLLISPMSVLAFLVNDRWCHCDIAQGGDVKKQKIPEDKNRSDLHRNTRKFAANNQANFLICRDVNAV
jgi:hypothetical protein